MPTMIRMMPIIPAGFTARMLQRSATGDQLDNENDQRDHEQKMNVSAENVEADKTKKPENQQNNKDGPEHKKTFRLRLLIMVRFVAGSCAYRKSRGGPIS
jgi:hypothetical protein